jgi:hypothetical protein
MKLQRKVRKEFGEMYSDDHEAFLCELEEKYGSLRKQKIGMHTR